MATEQSYNGEGPSDGNRTTFDITFPYLTHADIGVSVGGQTKTVDSDYSITGNTVTFTTAPATGTANVKLYRNTNIDTPEHEYSAGSSITAARLNENQRQALYAIEEAKLVTTTSGGITTGNKNNITVNSDTDWIIRANVVEKSMMADNSVGTDEIEANAVTASEIAANAVGASELADNAVDTAAIAVDAVNGSKIADNSIDSEHYVNGSIDSEHLAANIITESMLQSNSVTLAKLASALLTELKTTYSNPVGTVIWVASFNPPKGYLKCNGETINNGNTTFPIPSSPNQTLHNWHWESGAGVIGTIDTSALYAIVGSKLPDLRGEFIRGAAYGRSDINSTGTAIHSTTGGPSHLSDGSVLRTQTDDFKTHQHQFAGDDWVVNYYTGITNHNVDETSSGGGGASSYRTNNDTTNSGTTETRPRNIALLACIKY